MRGIVPQTSKGPRTPEAILYLFLSEHRTDEEIPKPKAMMAYLAREPSCHALADTYAANWRALSRHSMLSFLRVPNRLVAFDVMIDEHSGPFFVRVGRLIEEESDATGPEVTP